MVKPPILMVPTSDAICSTLPLTNTGLAPDTYGEVETDTDAALRASPDSTAIQLPSESTRPPAALLIRFDPSEKTVFASIRYVWPRTVIWRESGDISSKAPATNVVCAEAKETNNKPNTTDGSLILFFICIVRAPAPLPWGMADTLQNPDETATCVTRLTRNFSLSQNPTGFFCVRLHKTLQRAISVQARLFPALESSPGFGQRTETLPNQRVQEAAQRHLKNTG